MSLYENARLPEEGMKMREALRRVDEIHRAITRAMGRVEFLKLSAERANSRLTPVRNGRGVERSRVEYAVLESDAEQWGIAEKKKELEELLRVIRPLVESMPAGMMRAIATQRILQGMPCGLIAKRMRFCRSYIYLTLAQAEDRLCVMYGEANR